MILIDTNILVFAHNQDSIHHKKASQLLQSALELEFEACLAQQNLLEFFSVITSPKRIEKPLDSSEAQAWINLYLASTNIQKISPTKDTLAKALALAKQHKLSKTDIFDCYLAATMEENKVFEIYTDNVVDFKKFAGIKVVKPF